jgi:hypothetical protein
LKKKEKNENKMKKREKLEKKKKRKAPWITVVIHIVLYVGEQCFPHTI